MPIIQKLLSNNFISNSEEVSMKGYKEKYKEYLLLPLEDYEDKIFKEIYVASLINLPEKDDMISLLVAKTFSIIFRIAQNTLTPQLLREVIEYCVEFVANNRAENN